MKALLCVLVALTASLVVQPADAAPTRARPAAAKQSAAKQIRRLPQLKLKRGKLLRTPPFASIMRLRKGVEVPAAAAASNVLSVSAQKPVDGSAFLIALDADVIPADAPGFEERGVHVHSGGDVVLVAARAWVGDHDLLVKCEGALPEQIRVGALVTTDLGWSDVGHLTATTNDGEVGFALLTADALTDADNIVIDVSNGANQDPFRLDACTIERI